ncbi:MAG: riboflavin biosynthesis protein RibF [Lewinellaceae bacterium]|nr:riboflavin biosynthesis protein RibF [Lewinellaceae bacterium]
MHVHTDLSRLPVFTNAVVTIGSFDGVHTGHSHILRSLVELANKYQGESVVVTFEPHPRTVLQPDDPTFKLLTTTQEKIDLLRKLGIDHVVLIPFTLSFARQTAQSYVEDFLIKSFHPRCIVIGYDHRFGAGREGSIEFLRKYGDFEIQEIPAQEVDAIAVSSTKIRKALESSDLRKANRLLGHPFLLTGKVVRGNQIGRTLGFPTANLSIGQPFKLIPPPGIYAATIQLGGREYWAMLYIGSRPTLEDGQAAGQRIEVNIIGYQGNLYDKLITVAVHDFIRPDKKMDDLKALKAQIALDQKAIESSLAALLRPVIREDQVAIVILNYNTRQHLETYLPSVVEHSGQARIIVADNGSPDDSVAFLEREYPNVEIIRLPENHGFAQGYNEALSKIDAKIYVLLNSDVEVTASWLEPILSRMSRHRDMAVAQPKVLDWRDKGRFEYAGAAGGWIDILGYPFCRGRLFNERELDEGQYDEPQPCFWAAGAALFVRAELFHAIGGFDGSYFAHNEEIDLCWRLKRAGYSVWCIPESVVYHLGGGTLEYDKPRKVFLNFRNSLFSIYKNEPVWVLVWLIPLRLVLDGVAGLLFASQKKWGAVKAILQAHFSFYQQIPSLTRTRKKDNKAIQKYRRSLSVNKDGIYRGSVVFEHYLLRKKRFDQIIKK